MKWISIDKAKPKFKQLYIAADKDGIKPVLCTLETITADREGSKSYNFIDDNGQPVSEPLHIAAVTDPRSNEQVKSD